MTTNKVRVGLAERSYDILIGAGLLDKAGSLLEEVVSSPSLAVIITNPRINELYGARVVSSLKGVGCRVSVMEVLAGERYKTLGSANKVYEHLLELGADRQTVIIALGGGVIGDLAGFAAATFMRVLPYVQIPTTLLAQVDSSVGGKTAVNHRLAKNIIGAFYQPLLVIIDPEALLTLVPRELKTGLGEVVKYALIGGEPLLSKVRNALPLDKGITKLTPIIIDCCRFKAEVVNEDERDRGRRAILNYGHTIGHAIEAVAGYRRYNHGEAIAVGMIGAAQIAADMGWLSKDDLLSHIDLAQAAGLPLTMKNVDPDQVYKHLSYDKKRVKGKDHLVLLKGLGKPVVVPVEDESIKDMSRRLADRVYVGE